MLWKEMTAGFVIAGFVAVLPASVFEAAFLSDAPAAVRTVENVIIGPLIAVLSFVCSVGNIPLAAVLWAGGISFAGVIAFIYADLITLPIVFVYRKYYGTRFAMKLAGLMLGSMIVAALAVDGLFSALGVIPETRPSIESITDRGIIFNYTAVLNILFTLVGVTLVYLTVWRGAKDPVCRMRVDRFATPYSAAFEGRTYYFCSAGCREEFGTKPGHYAKHARGTRGGRPRGLLRARTVTAPPKSQEETVNHPLFARMYLRMASGRKTHGEDEYRRKLLAGLSGRAIEVGAGNGLNFPFYPAAVERVLAVEPEPLLREAARKGAAEAPVPVEVIDGVSGRLPADDASFDAGVASLVLCSVPDQQRALDEFRRVIRPGGELRFYEHVVANGPMAARLQRLADAVFWPRVGGGCHLSRDTGASIERAGFSVESFERFSFSPGAPVPPLPHILGVARRR